MSAYASPARAQAAGRAGAWPRRLVFVGLLVLAPLLPHLSSDGFSFPAVTNFWTCVPFCALFLLPVWSLRARPQMAHLDLLALLSLLVALGCEGTGRQWPVLLLFGPLVYLALRMLLLARIRRGERHPPASRPLRLTLGRSWLLVGIVVLAGVHVSWAVEGTAQTDVARGSVGGALAIVHGRPLYGPEAHAQGTEDPHTDTYGPFNYEAYAPLAMLLGERLASRLTTLFFDLLCAGLLFAIGRRARGPTTGVLLAYLWLAFPFSLYEDALAFNDSLLAATLLGTLLMSYAPRRRGAMAGAAAWTKLSPLALVPLLASYRLGEGRSARRNLLQFGLAFLLVSAVIFLPALAHSSLATFVSRTFTFQSQRPPANSLWAALQGYYALHTPWIGTAARIAHGLLVAIGGVVVLLTLRTPRRQDLAGLAAASAAITVVVVLCLSYFSYSYILWFAPLVLVAVVAGSGVEAEKLGTPGSEIPALG